MNNKILIICGIILLVFLLGYAIYDIIIKPQIQKAILDYSNQGAYLLAYEQTTKGVFYYINQNNTMDMMSLNELCKVE